ncbi:sensor histidine kinase [Nocardiopsis lambiniae]|uniref:histidine kinase n=1 Tax=Nocardiopsis lambiniae TaxID=3075539 RepID=A0ABU2M3S5_9ACTN|nr:histidine kinase [Nocardiopsis sp. DSM 44743]MDT0326966.1 histidine kinase [Nocardiopsis sp. DSM 44743]
MLEPSRRERRWAGHAGATLLVLLVGLVPDQPTSSVVWSPEQFALNLLAAAILLARDRMPFVVLPLLTVLAWISVPLGLFNPGVVTAAAIAGYAVTLQVDRRRSLAGTAVLAVVMLGAALAAHTAVPQSVLVVLLGGAIGDAIRTQREHMAAITDRAVRAENTREAVARQRVAEDRLAIARDLHDVVAHQIAVINLHAGVASSALRDRPDDAERSLATIREASRSVLTEIGDLLTTLRDPASSDIGPPGLTQLDDVVRDFATHGLQATVSWVGDPYDLPGKVDVAAMRVIQEALINANKHGTGRRASLVIEYLPRSLRVTVANPAPEPRADAVATRGTGTGYGLVGMAERVESVRGTLEHGLRQDGTWVLTAQLPTSTPENPE